MLPFAADTKPMRATLPDERVADIEPAAPEGQRARAADGEVGVRDGDSRPANSQTGDGALAVGGGRRSLGCIDEEIGDARVVDHR